MALAVGGTQSGVIGSLYARRNLDETYARQKAAGEAAGESASASDRVELSNAVPKPFSERAFEDALRVSEALSEGRALSSGQESLLREDRVFAALSALIAVGADGGVDAVKIWPGGLPTPTREELEAAYRRLSQRLERSGDADDPDGAARGRLDILEQGRGADFVALSASLSEAAPATG